MRGLRPFRLVAVALALLVLASCTSESPAAGPPPKSSAQRAAPAGPSPQDLLAETVNRFGKQKLKWGRCRRFASSADGKRALGTADLRCARLKVPLDYDQPGGVKISIGVLRRKATGKRIGALVTNPGGPGASGVEAAAHMVREFADTQVGSGSTSSASTRAASAPAARSCAA